MIQSIAEMQAAVTKTSSDWVRRLSGTPPIGEHTGIYRLHLEANATLCTALVRESVKKPIGVGLPEWVAAQTLGIYEEVLWLAALMEDLCTPECCPRMSAGKLVDYNWQDRPGAEVQRVTAVDYQRKLLEYTYKILADGDMIPQDGRPFPDHFLDEMKIMHKRFFRIYAHIYLHHFEVFRETGVEAHLNCLYKHFLFFVKEFDLVSDADMRPLRELNEKFQAAHEQELAEAARCNDLDAEALQMKEALEAVMAVRQELSLCEVCCEV